MEEYKQNINSNKKESQKTLDQFRTINIKSWHTQKQNNVTSTPNSHSSSRPATTDWRDSFIITNKNLKVSKIIQNNKKKMNLNEG